MVVLWWSHGGLTVVFCFDITNSNVCYKVFCLHGALVAGAVAV